MSPEEAIQKGVFAALSASTAVKALLGDPPAVFDRVPESDPFPRVTIGEDEITPDAEDCLEEVEAFVTVHIWSRAVGKMEAKAIGGAVREALLSAIDVDGFTVTEWRAQQARYFTDRDGLTTHGVIVIRYLFDAA